MGTISLGGFEDWDLKHVDIICVYKYTDDVILIYIYIHISDFIYSSII